MSRYIDAELTKRFIKEKMTSVIEGSIAGEPYKDVYLLAMKHAIDWIDVIPTAEENKKLKKKKWFIWWRK